MESTEKTRMEITNKQVNGGALCYPRLPRRVPGLSKVHRWSPLMEMALPKIQYGSHVNCQPGEENRGAITQRELGWSACGRKAVLNPARLRHRHRWRRKVLPGVDTAESPLTCCTLCPSPGRTEKPDHSSQTLLSAHPPSCPV